VNATGVTAGPAESNGRLLLSKWRDSLDVTCGLTACTPGSAPGPTLGNEYGKTLPFYLTVDKNNTTIAYTFMYDVQRRDSELFFINILLVFASLLVEIC